MRAQQQATATDFDAELRRHNQVLRQAIGLQPADHVLDIGCGTGQTTREAARTARAGSALGVDISAPAIDHARELADAEGLRNVTFAHADAQVHYLPQQRFDVAISRFGTMFFGDPVAAFANIGRALRPAGRLVMMVWQARELNEWAVVIRQCLEAEGWVAGSSAAPDAFSLADQRHVTDILEAAGFTGVSFADVDEPVFYGPDVEAALAWIRGFISMSDGLQRLSPAAATRAVERLRDALAARLTDEGVWFDSRAWIVSANRP
jgi:ubiquinone/menaquinone biosynthesis C-methylase UbiE